MKLNAMFPKGALAPGMKAYGIVPQAKFYGSRWLQSRKKTEVCVKEVLITRIVSEWDNAKEIINHQIFFCHAAIANPFSQVMTRTAFTVNTPVFWVSIFLNWKRWPKMRRRGTGKPASAGPLQMVQCIGFMTQRVSKSSLGGNDEQSNLL